MALLYSFYCQPNSELMNDKQNLKSQLTKLLMAQFDNKIELLQQSIAAAKESRDNETKSSVGDKYETGRAMVQMEIEKNQAQLNKTEAFKNDLKKINTNEQYEKIGFGSVVITSQGLYFISIPFGKIETGGNSVICISLASPIGQILAGKSVGDRVNFQGKEIEIKEVL